MDAKDDALVLNLNEAQLLLISVGEIKCAVYPCFCITAQQCSLIEQLCANYETGSVAYIPVGDMRTGELGPPVSSRHGVGAEAGQEGSRQVLDPDVPL
jgi:hypothetical protein